MNMKILLFITKIYNTSLRFKTQKKNLKIKPVQIEDTGIYICKGTNGFGSEEIRIDLIVIGKRYTTFFHTHRN